MSHYGNYEQSAHPVNLLGAAVAVIMAVLVVFSLSLPTEKDITKSRHCYQASNPNFVACKSDYYPLTIDKRKVADASFNTKTKEVVINYCYSDYRGSTPCDEFHLPAETQAEANILLDLLSLDHRPSS